MQNNPSQDPQEPVEIVPVVAPDAQADAVPQAIEAPATDGGDIAESYIRQELREARKSLRISQIVSIAVLLLTLGYMGYMTSQVRRYTQPEVAAEVANGIIAERVDLYADQAATTFKQQIPQFISQLPDQAIAAAPQLRQNLVYQVETQLENYSQKYSQQLGENIDEFLDKNKDQVGAILKDGQNQKTVAELGPELELQLAQFLEEKPADGGDSAQQQIDKSLNVLLQMKQRTDKLATGQNLTPDEQKARLAIAIIGKTIGRDMKGVDGQTLLDSAGKNLRDQIGKLGSPDISTDDGLNAPANSASANSASANSAAPAAP